MKKALLFAFALGFLLSLPGAWAFTVEAGTEITYGSNQMSRLDITNNLTLNSSLTFESITGAPIFDGTIIDLEANDGSWYEWNLTNLAMPYTLSVSSNTSVDGTMRVGGAIGYYLVHGVSGVVDFTVSGPSFTFNVPAGNQTIVITQVSNVFNGLGLSMDGEYNPLGPSLSISANLLDSTGNPITGAALTLSVFDPSGTLIYSGLLSNTTINGVYSASVNLTAPPTQGGYLATVQYGGTVTSKVINVVDMGLPSTLAIPLAIFGFGFLALIASFLTDKPLISMGSDVAEILCIWLTLIFRSYLNIGFQDMTPVLITTFSAFLLITGWRTFMSLRANGEAVGEEERQNIET